MKFFVIVFVPMTLALGLWQLQRAEEKRTLETAYLEQLTQLPVKPSGPALDVSFQKLLMTGKYTDQYFLVDNQVQEGVVGYWVVQVFDTDGRKLLINRGFTPAPESREQIPEVTWPAGLVDIVGVVWPDLGLIPVFGEDVWSSSWPKRVQRLDVARMAETTQAEPVEVRLEGGQPGVLAPAPFARVLGDEKHLGYAFTWFGLCATLIGMFVYQQWRQRHDSTSEANV